MKNSRSALFFAVISGSLLACMIFFNGALSSKTSPIWASFIAHTIGAVISCILFLPMVRKLDINLKNIPKWAFLGGIPGAATVIFASITVTSGIGLSGTISLMLLGQVVFGMLVDHFGAFHMKKRALDLYDFMQVLLVMTGSSLIIFFARY